MMSVIAPEITDVFAFPIGMHVYYFNQWVDFETKELYPFFTHLTLDEIKALRPGDIVWVDREPYHNHGKVYGFTKLKVHAVTLTPNGRTKVDFGETGFTTYDEHGCGSMIVKVHDEQALKDAIDRVGRFAIALK